MTMKLLSASLTGLNPGTVQAVKLVVTVRRAPVSSVPSVTQVRAGGGLR